MTSGRLIRLIGVIIAVALIWKFVIPNLKGKFSVGHTEASASAPAGGGCVSAARHASEAWGSGLGRFVNPPYDVDAWSSFKSDVDSKISTAESECSCSQQSCETVRGAMRDLRGIVSDLDSAIRSGGSVPQDVVQRQESVDNAIDTAADQAKEGK